MYPYLKTWQLQQNQLSCHIYIYRERERERERDWQLRIDRETV